VPGRNRRAQAEIPSNAAILPRLACFAVLRGHPDGADAPGRATATTGPRRPEPQAAPVWL